MGQAVNVYNIPVQLKTIKIVPQRMGIEQQFVATPIMSPELTLSPEGFKEISPLDIAQIMQETTLVQPRETFGSNITQRTSGGGISLRSLLAIETR
jgi:hypothetical protein